jgi:L-threonine kinase
MRGQASSVGVGTAFGTFGELLQGALPENDLDFMVTFPISRWTVATFRRTGAGEPLVVTPAHKDKSRRLAELVMREHGGGHGGILSLDSDLPEGKGFASSSADLVATARAVGDALGLRFDEHAIESFLRRIEPSDGVMYAGVVAFYHREVRLRERLGFLPPLTIVVHDEGGEVDTLQFNQLPKLFSEADKREYAHLLQTLSGAVRSGDVATVGQVATRSAELNGKRRRRQDFAALSRICQEAGGLGLVVTHSGTALGLLLSDNDADCASKVQYSLRACAALPGSVSVMHSLSVADHDRRHSLHRAVTPQGTPKHALS